MTNPRALNNCPVTNPSMLVAESDPCEQLVDSSSACSYGCQVVNGAAQCYCQSGYQLSPDQVTCVGE